MAILEQKIIPNLWFDRQAEEAAHFYASVFENASVGRKLLATRAGFEFHGLPEGSTITIEFTVEGLSFIGINGGPLFSFNPSVSFLVACKTREEVDALWGKLAEGGTPLMDIGKYPFSERYGWTRDKYGLSWQVMAMGDREIKQKITPALMFVGEQYGNAEKAIRLYTSVFKNSGIGPIDRYGKGEEPDKEGAVKYGDFRLENQGFAAMESAYDHDFAFNEAVSFMIQCGNQPEIDFFWDKLTRDGGQESMCGWLKDKYGVSWQVAPSRLEEMLHDPDREKVERVTDAYLKMKKFDIAELEKVYKG
ncbi:MAG: hypothetical protein H6P98_2577 [Candidatus Aminicenantes bacterium]|nr:hypothetical protein [Candidatus Aminicenantes bacterium]